MFFYLTETVKAIILRLVNLCKSVVPEVSMTNLILFINAFLSYFLVYVISAVVIVVAVLAGIRLRKHKDAKEAMAAAAEAESK